MAVASVPVPGGWLRWHPGIPSEGLARCCGYGSHRCAVPLSPSGLLTACLCSDKLIGAVNAKKGSALGTAFVVGWYPQAPSCSISGEA